MKKKKGTLRSDTTVELAEGSAKPGAGRKVERGVGAEPSEMYVRSMPSCCLGALKRAVTREEGEKRSLSLECLECERVWRVTSSLDERILGRFVTHGGPRVGGSHPAA